jgi:phospholipid-transporting ATPase
MNETPNSDCDDVWVDGIVAFGSWFLILMNFVPISLMVTLEMVKFLQGGYIQWDFLIFDEEKGQNAQCHSSNLNEQLGMVHYIFSDKTGTLTQNIMEFKQCTAGDIRYGSPKPIPKEYPLGCTNVNFDDDDAFDHLKN